MVEESWVTQAALEEDMRGVAWDIVEQLTVAEVLVSCVEALVETYKQDIELYHLDKAAIESLTEDEDDVTNTTE